MFRSITCSLIIAFLLSTNALATDKALVTYVSDGDTIHISLRGKDHRCRLIGIDTPESAVNDRSVKFSHGSDKRMGHILSIGEKAKEHVKTLVHKGDVVSLEYDVEREDKYHRILAYVYLANGVMLNEEIIRDGYAKPMTIPPNVRYVNKFLKAYEAARKQKVGLFSR